VNKIILNSNNRDGLFLSAVENERAVPCPDVVWVSVCRLSVGKLVAVRSRSGLQVLQHREGLKDDFLYLFTFSNASNAAILINI